MKKYLIVLILLSVSAWSGVNLELRIEAPQVRQGQLVKGHLSVKETTGNAGLSGLKGQNFGKTIYVYDLGPFMARDGQLEAEANVIFIKPPESTTLKEVVNGEEVTISWNPIEVLSTEETKSFLFGDFDVPARRNLLPWISGALGLLIALACGLSVARRLKRKSLARERKEKLKAELTSCATYDDIVLLWRQKRRFLEPFPMIEGEFKAFEEVLFRHQFKPQRSEQEVAEVVSAYEKFRANVTEVLRGV